jgi:hypothetical protein
MISCASWITNAACHGMRLDRLREGVLMPVTSNPGPVVHP